MKLSSIIALFTLVVLVKGAWWANLAQPVILGLGAAFAALDLDLVHLQPILDVDLRKLLIFKDEKDEKAQKD